MLPRDSAFEIDIWVLSRRVLWRQLEQATLNLTAPEARRLGAETMIGCYIPTAKNRMVEGHCADRGFF